MAFNRDNIPGDDKILTEPVEYVRAIHGVAPVLVQTDTNKVLVQLDTKTKQIQAQGCIQAAVQSPGLQMLMITDYESYWKSVDRLASDMLDFIQRKSQ